MTFPSKNSLSLSLSLLFPSYRAKREREREQRIRAQLCEFLPLIPTRLSHSNFLCTREKHPSVFPSTERGGQERLDFPTPSPISHFSRAGKLRSTITARARPRWNRRVSPPCGVAEGRRAEGAWTDPSAKKVQRLT